MAAFSRLRIPITARRPLDGQLAADLAFRCAGAWDARWHEAESAITVLLQFPGNITSMIHKIRAAGIEVADRIEISVPLRSIASPGRITDPVHFLHSLALEPNVFEPHLDGDRVVATIKPETGAAHVIYDHCLEVGLFPQDTPTLPALRGL